MATSTIKATNLIHYEYDIDLSYSAGAIGTRGASGSQNFPDGKKVISASIYGVSTQNCIPFTMINYDGHVVYWGCWRTQTSAQTLSGKLHIVSERT
jgi:hypothetical protein